MSHGQRIRGMRLVVATAAIMCGPLPSRAQDYADRDAVAPLMTAGLLDRRDDVSPALYTRYWRDVHGPLAARIDGFEQYWQHHLGKPVNAIWPFPAIDQKVPARFTIEGFAETSFRSADVRARLGQDPAAQALFVDERNAFRATYLYPSATGDSRTLLDRNKDPAPQGPATAPKYIVLVKRAPAASPDRFRSIVSDRLAPLLARADGVTKVRYHLLQPFDPKAWDTPGVLHAMPPQDQYAAILELGFRDEAARRRVLASPALRSLGAEMARSVAALHTYPEVATYTMVYDGRPTLVGLKGLSVAETIVEAGAANQLQSPVLRILNGFDSVPSALSPAVAATRH